MGTGATLAPKTMSVFLVIGVIGFLAPAASGADPVSVLSILKASKEAIESYDVQRNMEIVHKHYFTTTKENSLWYYAMQITKQNFGMELNLEDLEFTERIIQKMSAHMQSCLNLTKLVKADCFSRIAYIMMDLEHGLRWPHEESFGQDSQRAKWGVLYNLAALQAAHVAIVAINAMVDGYKEKMYLMKTKAVPFTECLRKHSLFGKSWEVGKNNGKLGPWARAAVHWREEQIGPAQLCDMKDYLWKPFAQFCETRWHSSEWVLEGPNDEFKGVKRSNLGINSSSIIAHENEERRLIGKRSELTDTLTGVELNEPLLLAKFGGLDNYHVRKYRVQVFDNVPKKVIFEAFAEAEPSSRGITLDKLAIRALKARSKAVKKAQKKADRIATALDAGEQLDKTFNYIFRQF